LVHGPIQYNGLGLPHLFTVQEISQLQSIINHTSRETPTGLLYRAELENLILEVSVGEKILEKPYHPYSPLATNCLLKKTWKFLQAKDIILRHDITLPRFQEGDLPLMQVWADARVTIDTLARLNKCRLFLNIYFLSEVMTPSSSIKPFVSQGIPGPVLNDFVWPRQGPPAPGDWDLWRAHLEDIRHAADNLGSWNTPTQGEKWYCKKNHRPFCHQEGHWLAFQPVNRSTRSGYFQLSGA